MYPRMLDAASLHVRHAVSSIGRSWRFSLVVTLVLSVGIAGATVLYGVADALLFRPIPYANAGSLYVVSTEYWTGGSRAGLSHEVQQWDLFERLNTWQRVFDGVAAYSERGANVGGEGWSERLQVGSVTRGFLMLLGVQPFRGRGFSDPDFRPEENRVALLTHALWQRRFGGNPEAVGRTILLNDQPHLIVGVLPPDFRSLRELETGVPTWFQGALGVLVPLVGDPTSTTSADSSGAHSLRLLARLSNPRRLDAARRELSLLSARFSRTHRGVTTRFALTPLSEALAQGVPERLALLAAAVVILLLVACANVALLLLQRRECRRREIEIRAALGATPRRLAAEGLLEAGLLGVLSSGLGLAMAWGALNATRAVGGAALTGLASVRIHWSVVGVAVTMSLGAAVLAGLVPFGHLLRDDLGYSWLRAPRTSQRPPASEPPSWIVVAQVGLSVALVVVTVTLATDFAHRAPVDLGYQPEGVLSVAVAVSRAHRPDGGRQFYEGFLSRLHDLPGVQSAAVVSPGLGIPVLGVFMGRVDGFGDEMLAYRVASRSLFPLLRVPVLAGRRLTEAEEHGAEPLVVVNNAFAQRYWGSARAALGRLIRIGITPMGGAPGPPVTVVGVVRDMAEAFRQAGPEIFVSPAWTLRTLPKTGLREAMLLVKAESGDMRGLAARVAQLAQEVDPSQPIFNVRPLKDLVEVGVARTRFLLLLVGAFSVFATFLAAVGVYVVLAFSVARRTHEFGVRLALGAPRRDVLLRVLARAVALVAKGAALTLPLTYCTMWLLAAQLLGVTETDPMTCAWAVAFILAAALLASVAPAWRAVRVDPTVALRQE